MKESYTAGTQRPQERAHRGLFRRAGHEREEFTSLKVERAPSQIETRPQIESFRDIRTQFRAPGVGGGNFGKDPWEEYESEYEATIVEIIKTVAVAVIAGVVIGAAVGAATVVALGAGGVGIAVGAFGALVGTGAGLASAVAVVAISAIHRIFRKKTRRN